MGQREPNVAQCRDLFQRLAHAIASGIPLKQAIDLLPAPPGRIEALRSRMEHEGLGSAGRHAGLFSSMEARLLTLGEHSGTLEQVARRIAVWYDQRERLRARFVRGATYPAILVLAALLLAPLPALADPETGSGRILVVMMLQVALFILLARGVLLLFSHARLKPRTSLTLRIAELRGRRLLPGRLLERDYLAWLYCLYAAGVDVERILRELSSMADAAGWRRRHEQAQECIRAGGSLIDALRAGQLVRHSENLLALRTGEHSGGLQEHLRARLDILDDETARDLEEFGTWLPRIVMVVVVVWLVSALLGGGALGPSAV